MPDVVTMGESMVLLVPDKQGRLRYANAFERYVAGAESNTAIGLVRLGHSAGWISRLGDDEFGAAVLAEIRGEGVDTIHVNRDPEAPTGVFFKERRRPDETHVYYYRNGSAASRLGPSDIRPDYIRGAEYVHLTGITAALSDSCRAALKSVIQIAREASAVISFDPNFRSRLWSRERAASVLASIVPDVDIVLAGADEAELLTGREDLAEAARTLYDMGPSQVVVKDGKHGAVGVAGPDGSVVEQPAVRVPVVEEIGAGDAYNAGYLSGCIRGWDPERAMRLGAVMGALAVTAPGDIDGLPTWTEVQPYLDGEISSGSVR